MQVETIAESTQQSTQSMAHLVRGCVHFLRVVRYRQSVLIGSVVVAVLLGGLYYGTATRFYQAKASLLVLQTGSDVTNPTMTADGSRQGLMPTYERLFASAVVLEAAARRLEPQDRIDFEGALPENWPAIIRAKLTATTIRMTNIIEISYRSKAPRAAVSVVKAVLQSYLEFMDKTHRGTAKELIDVFTREKMQVEQFLAQKQAEVLWARQQFGDLGIPSQSNVVHPVVQRVIEINQALTTAQTTRMESQAMLSAIEAAIRNGDNLDHYLMLLEASLGRELMLAGLGFSEQDVATQAAIDKQMLDDQTLLRTLEGHYGPNHPRIVEVIDRIRMSQNYLVEYRAKVNRKLAEIRQRQLPGLLIQMVRQQLDQTLYHEAMLRSSFEQARAQAVALIGDRGRLDLLEHDLKFLRELRDALLDKIASVDLRQDHGDIRTQVVSDPTVPKRPVWPKLPLIGLCSLMGGLLTGLGLIYVIDILDDRFRSPEEMQLELGAPLLAMIRNIEELNAFGLESVQVHVSPDAPANEAFRTLRTSLAFSGRETARLVVSSPEPGDGKTTVLVNLAVSFWQAGKRTLMIDGDMRRPGLSTQMGLKGQIGLSDLLLSAEHIDEAVPAHLHQFGPGFDFIAAGRRRSAPTELLTAPRMAELLAWAESNYDQIIIDSPPALAVTDASIIGRLVDGAVLVVQPAKNRRRLVTRAASTFTSLGVNLLGVVVNRIGDDKRDTIYADSAAYGYGYSSEDLDDAVDQREPADAAEAEDIKPIKPVAADVNVDVNVDVARPIKPVFEPAAARLFVGSAGETGGPATSVASRPHPAGIVPRRVA